MKINFTSISLEFYVNEMTRYTQCFKQFNKKLEALYADKNYLLWKNNI